MGKFSLDNIESISLYNGQKSEIFQSAKDYGSAGTIYIRTRKPKFAKGKKYNIQLTMKGGSFGLANPSLLWEQKISENVRAIVSPATPKIYRDALKEGIIEIFMDAGFCVTNPTCGACLGMSNGVLANGESCASTTNRNFNGRMGKDILKVIAEVKNRDAGTYPVLPKPYELPRSARSVSKMLRLLLMIKSAENDVAEKLIATPDELDMLAGENNPDINVLKGWRYQIFGKDALELKAGKTAMRYNPEKRRIDLMAL